MVGLFSFPLLVSGAYLGGLRGAVWALGANMAINGLMNHFALRKEAIKYHIPFTFKGCIQEGSILWKFSLPAALAGIMVGPVLWVCNAILVNQPGGYSQMGLFDAANQWGIIILFIPGMVGQISLPMLASLNDPSDRTKYRKVLLYNAIFNGCVALALALPIALFSRWIMKSYGKGFEQGQWILVCLAFTSVLVAVNSAVGQAIASKGFMWNGLLLNALWAVALLILSLILIRNGYGAIGLAFAYLISYILHSLWSSIYVFKKVM
jgi:O-antigen/teichoic acid export membrane protein